jgi:hypothetical protein
MWDEAAKAAMDPETALTFFPKFATASDFGIG